MRPAIITGAVTGLIALLLSCRDESPSPRPPLTLAEACESVLVHFGRFEEFKSNKPLEAGLAGHPAVRMEAGWKKNGQGFRGIIYVVEQPAWFNVIYYAAPEENGLFEEGLPAFQKIMRSLSPLEAAGGFEVQEREGERFLRSGELRLEFVLPENWVYALDANNHALVLSGPRRERAWLTTVNLSVVHKWPQS